MSGSARSEAASANANRKEKRNVEAFIRPNSLL
jgi:hypothetical protein